MKSLSERVTELENATLYQIEGPVNPANCAASVEGLLDSLIVLYDECSQSSLRRERTVSNFIETGNNCSFACVLNSIRLLISYHT